MAVELPENSADWPQDPFELMGLSRPLDERELKRTYARLLKLYKPEQKPAEFRLLRNAYESLKRYLEYQQHYQGFRIDDTAPTPATTSTTPDPESPSAAPQPIIESHAENLQHQAPATPVNIPSPAVVLPDPIADWDDLVRQDRWPELYQQLLELEQRTPGRPAAIIRLYWLLRVEPQLDPKRTALDWLLHGLLQSTQYHPALFSLFRREVYRDADLAFGEEFSRLLRAATATQAVELYTLRWPTALRMVFDHVIDEDLDHFRKKYPQAESTQLGELLSLAIECLCWSQNSNSASDSIALHAQSLDQLSVELRDGFQIMDRVELLREMLPAIVAMRNDQEIPDELFQLCKLIARPGLNSFDARLVAYLETIAGRPAELMQLLDRLCFRNTLTMLLIDKLLGQLSYPRYDNLDEQEHPTVLNMAMQYFLGQNASDYYGLRLQLLHFCLLARIRPLTYLELPGASIYQQQANSELFLQLQSDLPLRYAYELIVAFVR